MDAKRSGLDFCSIECLVKKLDEKKAEREEAPCRRKGKAKEAKVPTEALEQESQAEPGGESDHEFSNLLT